jgi:hypothetical protein
MAATYEAIATVEVGSGGAASIDFTSIAADWTDLAIKMSLRGTNNDPYINLLTRFNAATTGYTTIRLYGYSGAGAGTGCDGNTGLSYLYGGAASANSATANTFGSIEFYIPNYAGSNQKSYSQDVVGENNSGIALQQLIAGIWTGTSAITQITFYNEYGNFAQYSTATLYGIKNS